MSGVHVLGSDLALALDPVAFAARAGFELDPWQEEVLLERPARGIAVCSRQSGKSLVAAVDTLHTAVYRPGSTILLLSPSQRQSAELMTKVRGLLSSTPTPVAVTAEGELHLRFANGSRVFGLPGTESTVRGFTADLVVVDEAARVARSLITAIRPMLIVSHGRVLAMSTPNGRTGWFFEAWEAEGLGGWRRWLVPATDVPRISPADLAREAASMPAAEFRQEYLCSFEDAAGAVFSAADLDSMFDEEAIQW